MIRVTLTLVLGYVAALLLPHWIGIAPKWGVAGLTASAGIAGWVEFWLLRRAMNRKIGVTGVPLRRVALLWLAALLAALPAFGAKLAMGVAHPVDARGGRAPTLRLRVPLRHQPRGRPGGRRVPPGGRCACSRARDRRMQPVPDQVAQKLAHLPDTPGVYLWKDVDGNVLYVGKAKRLRPRVRSYYADQAHSPKTQMLMALVADLETIVVPSETHALLLEYNLIKEHRPRFNIVLRDDKSYPYVKVTVQEPYPRVFVTRRLLNDGARYFGPYTDVGAMRRALNIVKRIFTVRSCSWDMPAQMPERACLDYYIKRCKGPCIFAQSLEDYRAMIEEVLIFLDGRTAEVVRRVKERMNAASEAHGLRACRGTSRRADAPPAHGGADRRARSGRR